MKKETVVIIILFVLLSIAAAILIFGYFKGQELVSTINRLETEKTKLSNEKDQITKEKEECISEKESCIKDKEQALSEKEKCTIDLQVLNSKFSMLQEDVARIYKSCTTQNACKGRTPNVRWNCNSIGDELNTNPTHICICDSTCNLSITEIKRS